MAGGRIKGVAAREFVRWYGQVYGDEAVHALAAALPEDFRPLIDARAPYLGLISSEWYPAHGIHAVLDKMMEGRPQTERAAIAKSGAEAVIHETLHGVYKVFFEMMVSPERYLKNAQKLFSRFFDQGEMDKTATGPSEHTSVIRGWTAHHPLLCQFLRHISEYVYSAMGCKGVTAEKLRCIADGDEDCAYRVRWS
jgi:hypothetical protein